MKFRYTFWELLNDYKIEIPKIQRDYAQGRKDVEIEKIVDIFLNDIRNSLSNNTELNLDFVYGRIENTVLTPLDGQQRLTTLFLIHWYIALKENKLTDENKSILSKFTYETRVSSEDFCKNLVFENIDYNSINENISDTITDSKWYFLSWKSDPTVSAMLNMLDTIHKKFKDINELLFERLEQEKNIIFQFLPLEQFKLTDELYIKMNARGKPLTEFENFKAKFSQYLKPIAEKSKLDNEWLDIFWNLDKREHSEIITENVDTKYFYFFKNITLNFFTETHDIDTSFVNNYSLFDVYKDVFQNEEYINKIILIFDGLIDFNDKMYIFKDFLSPSVNYWERLRFYSLSLFFVKYGQVNQENQNILDCWLRVTINLINNTLIQSAENYKEGIRSLNKLSKHISNIYTYVSSTNVNIKYFSKLQREEESLKAKLILDDVKWEDLFVRIEKHPYFDGQVGFILRYSKSDENYYNKMLFEDYLLKLSKLFDDEFCEKYHFLFQRSLLTKGDYLVQIGQNKTFCIFDVALRAKLDNWRKVFNDEEKSLLLKSLLDDLDNNDILTGLEKIIKSHTVNNWRKLLIDHPDSIAYCQYRQIRWYSGDEIYLLSKGQMNGRHKELYSLDLYNRKFKQRTFSPFSDKSYYWESTSWEKPCIVLATFKYKKSHFEIDINYGNDGKFTLHFIDWKGVDIPPNIENILLKLNFKEKEISLPEDDIEEKLNNICEELNQLLLIGDEITT